MDKITTINGILLGTQNDFNEHVENTTVHLTEEERDVWNAKADASSLSSKVDTAVFTAHKANAVVHITEEEREKWNKSPEMDADGNMTVPGNITAQGGMFSRDVTMAQSLNVAGKSTIVGGVDTSAFTLCNSTDGTVEATIKGYKKVESGVTESGFSMFTHGGMKFLDIVYDEQNKLISFKTPQEDSTLNFSFLKQLWIKKCYVDYLKMGPFDFEFDPRTGVRLSGSFSSDGLNVRGATTFEGGVTMSQDLNVAGGGTFTNTVNANGGINIPVDPVAAGDAVNLANLPMSLFAPRHSILPLKSLWECNGAAEDTACGIKFKDLAPGGFGGICTRIMQWSDWAASATILTAITLTGGNGANVLIDAAYNPNTGGSITPTTSPNTAFLPNAVQLSLFETRQGTTITGRLVGVDGTAMEFSVPSQQDSHSCVYRVFLLETAGVIKFYLGQFTSGIFDGDADTLERPVYLGEMPVFNNSRRFCFLGIGGLYGGEGNSFPARIPIISGVCRYYGSWLTHLFPQK